MLSSLALMKLEKNLSFLYVSKTWHWLIFSLQNCKSSVASMNTIEETQLLLNEHAFSPSALFQGARVEWGEVHGVCSKQLPGKKPCSMQFVTSFRSCLIHVVKERLNFWHLYWPTALSPKMWKLQHKRVEVALSILWLSVTLLIQRSAQLRLP